MEKHTDFPQQVSNKRYVDPTPIDCSSGPAILSTQDVHQWRKHGYLLKQGLIPEDLALACRNEALEAFEKNDIKDFGSEGKMEFPCGYEACDALTLHPNLLSITSQLLSTPVSDLRLIQSDVWPKLGVAHTEYDPLSNKDQRIHCDYGNNTLVHPPSWEAPEVVTMIVYLSDEPECGGGTAVAPRTGDDDEAYQWPIIAMPGYGGLPFINDRKSAEEYMKSNHPDFYKLRKSLYDREYVARYRFGTVLVYRHDIWHRGTPVNPGKLRIVVNLGYKKAECDWITTWNAGFAKKMYYGFVEKMLSKCSIEQRNVLGFPPLGSKYWNNQTLNAVEARYKPYGFDITAYRDAFVKRLREETGSEQIGQEAPEI